MAGQNRKTRKQIDQRAEAERVVDHYLDFVFADSQAGDIALESRSILGTFSEHGELPRGSGFAGFCKLGGKVDRMRRIEVTPAMLAACSMISHIRDYDHLSAVCVDRMYRGHTKAIATDPLNGKVVEITYRAAHCADMLRISEEAYRKRVSRAYQDLEAALFPDQKAA